MAVRMGVSGLGRIGRCVLRRVAARDDIELAGVNDLVPMDQMAYLIRHDSVHGEFPGEVEERDSTLKIADMDVPYLSESKPEDIPWDDLGAEIVIESTGAFRSREDAARHLEGGAKRVIISAPSDDADVTIVPGVNGDRYEPESHQVISMASCTTNCVAPVLEVLHESFGVEQAMFTTVHAYTSSQSLVDGPARKWRRGRAAAVSLVPTTTGAATATELALPELEGRVNGMAIRAPVPNGSLVDLVANLGSDVSVSGVLDAFRQASAAGLGGVLGVAEDELVSSDIVGNPLSALIDAPSAAVLMERQVKVIAWYDNEMGYAARLVDLSADIGES